MGNWIINNGLTAFILVSSVVASEKRFKAEKRCDFTREVCA